VLIGPPFLINEMVFLRVVRHRDIFLFIIYIYSN
jgi:hypothetical protein